MSSDLLLSHLKSVKSSTPSSTKPETSSNKRKRAAKEVCDLSFGVLFISLNHVCISVCMCNPYPNLSSSRTSQVDYAAQARTHLSQKKARVDHRIQITTLAQPAKKNKKKLRKLVKLAKEASKL